MDPIDPTAPEGPTLNEILATVRAVVARTPGLVAAHYPPPSTVGTDLPCAVIEVLEGTIDLAGSEMDTERWVHEVKVTILYQLDNLPARYPVVVGLVKAIAKEFRSELQLGGDVQIALPRRYQVGAVAYAGAVWTGANLFFTVEEMDAVEFAP